MQARALERGVECTALDPRSDLGGELLAVRRGAKTEHAERERDSRTGLAVVDLDQLKAPAAKVSHHAACFGHCRQHAESGELRFLVARQHARLESERGDLLEESRAVRCFAYRCSRNGVDGAQTHVSGELVIAGDGRQRTAAALLVERPVTLDPAAQGGADFLVEQMRRHPCGPAIGHEAHRVGADVDDPNGPECLGRHQPPPRWVSRNLGTSLPPSE